MEKTFLLSKKAKKTEREKKYNEMRQEWEDFIEIERFERELEQQDKEAAKAKAKAEEEEEEEEEGEINPLFLGDQLNKHKLEKIKQLLFTQKVDNLVNVEDTSIDNSNVSEGCSPNLTDFHDIEIAEIAALEVQRQELEVQRKELEVQLNKYKELQKKYLGAFSELYNKLCDKPHEKKGGKTRRSKYQDSKLFHKKKGGKTRRSKYQDSKLFHKKKGGKTRRSKYQDSK